MAATSPISTRSSISPMVSSEDFVERCNRHCLRGLGVTVQPMIRAQGYELILGSTIDAQFGPVILFGSGGQLVEVYRDRALALPPLNTTLAERLMEHTKILKALRGVRGRKAVDLLALETLLLRFSELIVEQPRLREVDINPVLASGGTVAGAGRAHGSFRKRCAGRAVAAAGNPSLSPSIRYPVPASGRFLAWDA